MIQPMEINTSGEIVTINSDGFTLEKCQTIVGGLIKIISLDHKGFMILNKEAIMLGLPINKRATMLYKNYLKTNEKIYGKALIIKRLEFFHKK